MTRFHRMSITALALFALLALPAAAAIAAATKAPKGGLPGDADVAGTYGDAQARKDLEKNLIETLKGAAPREEKELACRKLWIVGSAESVPALAALLPDKDLSHMARYALEGMPCPEAGKALRDAVAKTAGREKAGVINSLGVREDKEAVAVVAPLVKDADPEIASSAMYALGRIGTPEAAKALADARAGAPKELKAVAADSSLKAAEGLLRSGNKDEAAKIYQDLSAMAWPAHVRTAAFLGLVAAKPVESPLLLMHALAGSDAALRNQAAQIVADMTGADASKEFADGLAKLPPEGQKALLRAFAMRKNPAARQAVIAAAKSSDKGVQAAAVAALGTTGSAAEVPMLAGLTASADADVAKAALASLAALPGDDVNAAIVVAIASAAAPVKAQLIAALGVRGATKCVAVIVQNLGDTDGKVREAALVSLAALGGKDEVAAVVKALKAAKEPSEHAAAEEALLAIASRVKADALPALLAGMEGADAASQGVLLRALGRIGGQIALDAVLAATKSADTDVQDNAVRVLSDWPDAAAAPHLLDIAKTSAKTAHQVLGVRGYVRLAGMEQSDDVKARMLGEAFALAKRPEEKRLVVSAWGAVSTVQAFQVVVKFLDDPEVAGEAATAAVAVGDKVVGKAKSAVAAAMQKIIETTKDDRLKRGAQKVLAKAK